MVQVLHLTSTTADLSAAHTAAAIRRAAGDDEAGSGVHVTTRTTGRGGVYRHAAHAALSLRFGRGILFDAVHAFDVPSLLAACAGPSPVVFSPSGPPAITPAWLAAAMVYRNGTVIANTAALRRRLIAQGVPAPRCDVLPPPVDLSHLTEQRDESLRADLGIAPDDRVVLAPGESIHSAGHLLALHAISILHVLDRRCRLLVWGRGPSLPHLRHLAKNLRQSNVLVVAEERVGRRIAFEQLLAAADFALVTAPGVTSSTPIAMCMAAGLPIVAGAAPATSELLADGRTASVAPTLAPRLIAQRLLRMIEDPAGASALGRGARTEAARRFDARASADRFLALYRQIAGVAPKGHWIASFPNPESLQTQPISRVG
ncbi:MAG TPA: glycosyltransferase family 4 protein [Tepidisphaeraceae bacterium]|jgi:glycosyltransferase involved in cell wall biosynthesis